MGGDREWGLGVALDSDGYGMGGLGGSFGRWSEAGQYGAAFLTAHVGDRDRGDRLEGVVRDTLGLPLLTRWACRRCSRRRRSSKQSKPTSRDGLGIVLRRLAEVLKAVGRHWLTALMSPSLHGLRTVIYPAPDLDAAKAWWTEFLGAEPYFDQPFYVGYKVAGYELGLLPDGAPEDGALTYWGVNDVAEAVHAAIEAGATEHTPPSDVGDDIVTATVRTPQHTVVGFISNPHFNPA